MSGLWNDKRRFGMEFPPFTIATAVTFLSLVAASVLTYVFLTTNAKHRRRDKTPPQHDTTTTATEPSVVAADPLECDVTSLDDTSVDFTLSVPNGSGDDTERRRSSYMPKTSLVGGLGKTALFIAAARAIHSAAAAPLFHDEFAGEFAGEYGRRMLKAIAKQLDTSEDQLAVYTALRTHFFDQRILALTNADSTAKSVRLSQLVILGVGSDTRSLRLPLPASMRVFECDTDEVLTYRQRVIDETLKSSASSSPCAASVELVCCDVTAPSWTAELISAGFDRQRPTIFVVENLFPYISNAQCKKLISDLSGISARDSRVFSDMFNTQYYKHEDMKRVLDAWEKWSTRPVSGIDLPEALWTRDGFSAQVFQYGQTPLLDCGLISAEEKHKYLVKNVRGSTSDWPRSTTN